MSMNTWNTKWTLPFYIKISNKGVFLVMINYRVLFSLTCITILIAYSGSFVDGWFWWAKASGIQESVHCYKTNSRGGVFPIMNNYCFWNMFNITNCVFILTIFNPLFFPFSRGQHIAGEMMCGGDVCNFLFVLVCIFCFVEF